MRRPPIVSALIAGLATFAVLCATADAAGPLSWSGPMVIDRGFPVLSIACPSADLCAAGTVDGLFVSTDPAGGASAWQSLASPSAPPHSTPPVGAVSCPSGSFCVAIGSGGEILTSTNPGGGASAWATTHPGISGLTLLSCASASLCMAASPTSRTVAVTTNPAGGQGSWKTMELPKAVRSIWCTAPRLCLAGTRTGDLLSSTNPSGGARAWHAKHIIGRPGAPELLSAVACASARYCVVAGGNGLEGLLFASSHPTGGARAWSRAVGFDPAGVFSGGSCVPTRFCAFAAFDGSVSLTADRNRARVDSGHSIEHISCASRYFCGLAGGDGRIYIGTSG
jgi:hypothetical protein